ncbi:MAG: DNA primase [Candidatus Brocadia sinica]|nr:MAG: DNA primase [Candidatus Brocadia sinica]
MYSVIQTAKDFGVDVEWAVSRRKEYLNQRVTELKNGQQSVLQLFSGNNELSRFLLLDSMKYLNNELKKCEMELNFKNTQKGNRITQTDIERAKAYPIESLLQNIKGGKTHCIGGTHKDKHPSMDVRNNFAHCYSCGWHGDAIGVFMQVNGVNFITAVKTLNG